MENLRGWLMVLVLFLNVTSPVAGVVLGMVYVHGWVAGHHGFLLQDFVLVTLLALAGGQIVAPVLLTVVFLAVSLVLLVVAAALAVVFVPLLVAVRVLSLAGSLALDLAVTVSGMMNFPRCLYCGRYHEHAMVWAPPHRWRHGGGDAAGA